MQKLCDAADWLDPEFDRIVRMELHELPRYHRKQWEFAQIFRALRDGGLLEGDKAGLALGAGRERLLYAVANHVGKLHVTDLYRQDGAWENARTADPEAHVKSERPFPYEAGRIAVKAMDMRSITYPDESVDFCYSSCAIEHIGKRADFLRHLREVARVLKPKGKYIFTTEMVYNSRTCEWPGNFLFSPGFLNGLFQESGLTPEPFFQARIWEHTINYPKPANLSYSLNAEEGRFHRDFFGTFDHLQLLQADLPFTSAIFSLTKESEPSPSAQIEFDGFERSCRFMSEGVSMLKGILEEQPLTPHPYAHLPDRRSAFSIGHRDFDRTASRRAAPFLFHTDYLWLGSGEREVTIRLRFHASARFEMTLGVNRIAGRNPGIEEEIFTGKVALSGSEGFEKSWTFPFDARDCYAFHAAADRDAVPIREVSILLSPASGAPGASKRFQIEEAGHRRRFELSRIPHRVLGRMKGLGRLFLNNRDR